jgi:hypothetical protein
MAAAIGGFVNTSKTGEESFVRTRLKRTPRLSDFLPLHEKLWLEAIETYIRASLSGAITE